MKYGRILQYSVGIVFWRYSIRTASLNSRRIRRINTIEYTAYSRFQALLTGR
jgi:hypothetical protein